MSQRLLAVLLPTLLACSQSATTGSPGTAPAVTENDEAARRALSQVEDDWIKAVEAHDTMFFTRVIASDFHGTADSAKTFDRAAVIRDAADTTSQLRDLGDQDREIRIYGNGTVGVVTGRSTWTETKGERPGKYSGRFTEVFVKRDGRWQAVAGHYTLIPPSTSQP